jgi:hypothetical protein
LKINTDLNGLSGIASASMEMFGHFLDQNHGDHGNDENI